MRILHIPPTPKALIFDLDSTLYEHREYALFQSRVLIERLARERGEPFHAIEAEIEGIRAARLAAGLGATSLGNIFLELGVDIKTSVRWRIEAIEPSVWLEVDPKLRAALEFLTKHYSLALVTNNPRIVGEKSLRTLGVRDLFAQVIGLDDTMRSKPDAAPFTLATVRLGLPAAAFVSIGDREEVDLLPARGLGMGAILIEAVADVYKLPEALNP